MNHNNSQSEFAVMSHDNSIKEVPSQFLFRTLATRRQERKQNCVNFFKEPQSKQWMLSMYTCNYKDLKDLAASFPNLVKFKDPCTGYTALHCAAKKGNLDIVNLLAGTYGVDVNERTNGGYTPLHIAAQFKKRSVYNLLSRKYLADTKLTDWNGKKPAEYFNVDKCKTQIQTPIMTNGTMTERHQQKTKFPMECLKKMEKSWTSLDNLVRKRTVGYDDTPRTPTSAFAGVRKTLAKHLRRRAGSELNSSIVSNIELTSCANSVPVTPKERGTYKFQFRSTRSSYNGEKDSDGNRRPKLHEIRRMLSFRNMSKCSQL